jgi:hypothetical protein
MFSWFGKHFIPHKGNGHRPYFLHGENARRIVVIVLALELIAFAIPSLLILSGTDFIASVLPGVLNQLTNERRSLYSLNQLQTSPVLTRAAELKVADMAARGYFAHNTPEGLPPWHWLQLAGYKYSMAGENLAIQFSDSEDVTEAWMNSPTHRDNVLKNGFTEVGTAVAVGMYQGRETIFVVQYYGKPAVAYAPTPKPQAPASKPVQAVAAAPRVLGEEIETKVETQVTKVVTSPRKTVNTVFYAVLAMIGLALAFIFTKKTHLRHPDLVTNGLAVACLIFALHLTNTFILKVEPLMPQDAQALVLETTIR